MIKNFRKIYKMKQKQLLKLYFKIKVILSVNMMSKLILRFFSIMIKIF